MSNADWHDLIETIDKLVDAISKHFAAIEARLDALEREDAVIAGALRKELAENPIRIETIPHDREPR